MSMKYASHGNTISLYILFSCSGFYISSYFECQISALLGPVVLIWWLLVELPSPDKYAEWYSGKNAVLP